MLTETIKNRQEVLALVRKWGDVNTDGLLEETCQTFFIPEIDGFIGYKIESGHAVVFGDPVCSPNDKIVLAKAFDKDCKTKNLGVVYSIVSQDFAEWASKNSSAIAIEFGNKFILDPHKNPTTKTGSKAVLVRKKVKQALKEGVEIKEYIGNDPLIEKQIEEVALNWVQKRRGPQIYLSRITLFNDRMGKRWFYAQQGGSIVGLLLLNELQAKNGWLLNNVMINGTARGISELLVVATLEALDKEGCRFVLAGPAPAKRLNKIEGVGGVKSTLVQLIFKMARYVFQLDGLATFWDKFQPQYESSFLLFPNKNLRFSSIKALMQALNANKGMKNNDLLSTPERYKT
jgi:lysylphosphatidylglycerol synthetase-like protein (DUF2156 family)